MLNKRFIIDAIAAKLITFGGISVILFILLVFIYLFRQVLPLFQPATVATATEENFRTSQNLLYTTTNEYKDVLIRLERSARLSFYDLTRERIISEGLVHDRAITAVSKDAPLNRILSIADQDGGVIILEYGFEDDFSTGSRMSIPQVVYPLGRESIKLSDNPISLISSLTNEQSTTIVTYDEAEELKGTIIFTRINPISRRITRREEQIVMPQLSFVPNYLQLFNRQENFIAASKDGKIALITISEGNAQVTQNIDLSRERDVDIGDLEISDVDIMTGANSVLIASNIDRAEARNARLDIGDGIGDGIGIKESDGLANEVGDGVNNQIENGAAFLQTAGAVNVRSVDIIGEVSQWFMIRDGDEDIFTQVRDFDFPEAVAQVKPALSSKSFVALTASGRGIYINSPSRKESFNLQLASSAERIAGWDLAPRSNAIIAIEKSGVQRTYDIDIAHPDISTERLISRVWYEGYPEASYVWQSTSGSNDFEPKYSLIPLSFGTLKAAFYAMLFSAPLAVAGAIYTAFFMGRRLRNKVKPIIEMMEAFPTVILGFIAGIVVAPFFEKNLPGILSIILFLTPSILLFGLSWRLISNRFRFLASISEGLVFIPFLVLVSWLALESSPYVENSLFDGDMRTWLNNNGIDFNQRNALVIGVAMGLAVIPTIYSIAEDAVYSVPRLMVNGAYALGATPMQNTITVVIPAALSGITSALMIGFGRAVGETMIVLMATGNTPVIDLSIFTGMRTLAANIAVELPEAPVGSSHFRVLFLCGFILLTFTFMVNILAEIIRQRIRRKYANVG